MNTQIKIYPKYAKFISILWLLVFLLGFVPKVVFSAERGSFEKLGLYANIETIGVVLSGVNLPENAKLLYRQSEEATWRIGHPLMRIDDGRLVGSLFELLPSTSYIIKIVDDTREISGSVITQPENFSFNPSTVLYVDDDAKPGGDGSVLAPYISIQEGVNNAVAGTQILVADGLYHEEVSFPISGSEGNWIQVKAEGNGAVLDGSKNFLDGKWKHRKGKIWTIKIESLFSYLARDQQRFYNYKNLRNLLKESKGDGWYLDSKTMKLYVRSQDNPANHTWQVPFLNHAFDINNQDWIWIEGFEMQFYGTQLDGCGVCTENASHIIIRKNKIHNIQLGVYVNWTGGDDRGNDTRIEYNEIYDHPVNEWAWHDVKASSMEGTAIVLRGHVGAIVHGNDIHHFFNGIYTGSSAALENPELAFDIDVYDNYIHHISDDALEPEGASINHRFRNNSFDSVFVGVSLAPVTMGPVWILRSTFSNYTGRGIKWAYNSDGVVLIYHNTFWTMAQDIVVMDFITPAHNAILRNNIFENMGYAVYEVPTGSNNQNWDHNNWYGTYTPRIKWENKDYDTITELCTATGLSCNGHEDNPELRNPNAGDFKLNTSSPNIDRGVVISGINDGFSGSAPDIGAYETISMVSLPTVPTTAPTTIPKITSTTVPTISPTAIARIAPKITSILRADLNPTSAAGVNFVVVFSEAVRGVDIGDFLLSSTEGINSASIANISGSENTYTISVFTGKGEGSICLELLDNDSIINNIGTPLGGVGAGNGNFTGETYTVDKTVPVVTAILRSNTSPTAANEISFRVGFTESVSGVDASDFALHATGNISGASITNISGSENMYTISVKIGNGNGTLALRIIDDDSIIDALGNPLGGVGINNGDFFTGEEYIINKIPQKITTQTFKSNAKHDGWILESSENSNQGEKTNAHSSTIVLGDNHLNSQFRSILHFSTRDLPNDAVITDVMLLIKNYDMTSTNLFSTHQNILVDIQYGAFGFIGPFQQKTLQSEDFQSQSCKNAVGIIRNVPMGDWHWTLLDSSAFSCINHHGNTQLRLRFQVDDNNNLAYDYLRFYSGDADSQNRPRLIIKYYQNK